MAKITRETLAKKLFSDAKNYPYGFSRSGDFSINESKALAQYGSLVAALVDGHLSPESEEETGIVEAAFGQKEPQTVVEKAWVKYQKRINRPRLGNINGSSKNESVDDTDDESADLNDDLIIEVDE